MRGNIRRTGRTVGVLCKDKPVLIVRGAVSDILDEEILAEMAKRKPNMRKEIVLGRGHCPSLSEPEAVSALDAFLAET